MKVSQLIQASSNSYLIQVLEGDNVRLTSQLVGKLTNYLPKGSKPKGKIDFANGYMNVRLWIDLTKDEKATQNEAQELAEILLGPNVVVGPHSLVPRMWVAVLKVKL